MSVLREVVFGLGSLICGVSAYFCPTESVLARVTLVLAALGIATAGVFSRFSLTWRLNDEQRRSLGDMGIILGILFPSLAVLLGILIVAALRS